jgi:glycolate oxidase FAD binding subunit
VIKNVAGYDVARLMVGALGTLGVLLDVSLKVLPTPARELTLCFEMPADKAIATMNAWAGKPLPLSAACYLDDTTNIERRASAASRATLYIRLSGTESGVRAASTKLGGAVVEKGDEFWRALREHGHGFFQSATPLWRLSVPPATPPINLSGQWIIDWGGAQRWFMGDAPAAEIRRAAEGAGGYASLFRNASTHTAFSAPPDSVLARLQQNLRQAFDPAGVLNPFSADQRIALGFGA